MLAQVSVLKYVSELAVDRERRQQADTAARSSDQKTLSIRLNDGDESFFAERDGFAHPKPFRRQLHLSPQLNPSPEAKGSLKCFIKYRAPKLFPRCGRVARNASLLAVSCWTPGRRNLGDFNRVQVRRRRCRALPPCAWLVHAISVMRTASRSSITSNSAQPIS